MRLKHLCIFIFFWLLSFAFYFKTAGAGFASDTVGWFQIYRNTGWEGLLHAFGDKSLHFVYHFLFFFFWKILGLNGICWMILFISVHAIIATLSFNIFETLFLAEEIRSASLIAFMGSLLFVVSPYFTEPLVWYACIHYLFSSLLLLAAFRVMLFYLGTRRKKHIFLFYLFFCISLFALEISFVFPVLLLLFFLFWSPKIYGGVQRLSLIKFFVVPSFLLLIAYFGLSQILRGSIVGHYGAATHLNFDISLLMGNLAKYIAKIFFLSQFIDYKYRSILYTFFETEKFAWTFFFLLILSALLFIRFHKRLNPKCRISILLFAFFAVALLPVINIFFSHIVNIEGDRFTYFASLFAYPFLSFVCVVFLRKVGWFFLLCFALFQIKFLTYNTESWQNAGRINQSLIEQFRWRSADKVYLLNVPDNFRGAYMFRTFPPDDPFAIALDVKKQGASGGNITHILQYNMDSDSDSVTVEKISEKKLKVTFAQWSGWWWRKGIGATDYSTDDYSVKIDERSHSYILEFKSRIPNSVYLYQCGNDWREFKEF